MPEQRSFLEAVTPADQVGELRGVLRIRPVVVDSSFFVADVLRSSRTRRRSTFLEAVMCGVLRPFAAHHVWAEVPRVVARLTGELELDANVAESIWWQEYVPRIHFVDVGGLPTPHADEILGRDPTDAPTVALAGLLAPVVVLAADRDLRDIGIAAQKWFTVVQAAGRISIIAEGSWAGMGALCLTAGAAKWAIQGTASALRRTSGQLVFVLLLVGVAIAGMRWRNELREQVPRVGRRLRVTLEETVFPWLGSVASVYQAATTTWEQAAYQAEQTSLQQRVARTLALNPHGLNRTQMARVLLPDGSDYVRRRMVRGLRDVLASIQAFSSCEAGRWELGCAGVDFGGPNEPVAGLLNPAASARADEIRNAMYSHAERSSRPPIP